MAESRQDVSISTAEKDAMVGYRPLCRMAVASFGLGLLSMLAVVGPLLWVLPAVAACLAVMALWRIQTSDPQMTGRKLAVVTLVLALFFGAFAPARFFARRATLFQQAREHADHWLSLVCAGQLNEAHQLTLEYTDRESSEASLEEFYARQEEDEQWSSPFPMEREPWRLKAEFFAQPPTDKIVQFGSRQSLEFEAYHSIMPSQAAQEAMVELQYRLTYQEQGQQQSRPVRITMRRLIYPHSNEAHWNVERVWELDVPIGLTPSVN